MPRNSLPHGRPGNCKTVIPQFKSGWLLEITRQFECPAGTPITGSRSGHRAPPGDRPWPYRRGMTQPAEPDIHKMNQKLIALEREVEDLKKKVKQLESKVGTAGGRDG
jgi:hypothetical protein